MSLLKPTFDKQLIYNGEDGKEIIFPVNAKRPGPYDHKVTSEMRKAVMRAASSIEPQQIPIKWDVLERRCNAWQLAFEEPSSLERNVSS